MKLVILLIFFVFSACSITDTKWRSPASTSSCTRLAVKFLEGNDLLTRMLNKFHLDATTSPLAEYIKESLLTESDWKRLFGGLDQVIVNDENSLRLRRLIPFLSGLSKKDRDAALNNVDLFFASIPFTPLTKKFQREINAIEDFKIKIKKEIPNEIKAIYTTETYERILLSCSSRGTTRPKVEAAKKGSKFFIGLGIASSSASYFYNNWDKEKDSKWFGNLGYDLVAAVVFNYAYTRILSRNQSGYLPTVGKSYLTFAALDFVSAKTYAMIFGISEEVARKKIDTILKSEDAVTELERLVTDLGTYDVDEAVTQNIKNVMFNLNSSKLDLVYENPETMDLLLEAITLDTYYKSSGDFIQTGNLGDDRYLFHRAWDLVGTPKGIAIGMVIFDILCKDAGNPKVAIAKALSIYLADRIVFDYLYYRLRRQAINM